MQKVTAKPQTKDYIVQDWIEADQKLMDTAVEGGFKTWLGLALGVSVASGTPFLGQPVKQGRVLIVDEEEGEKITAERLQRLAMGVGCSDWRELPIKLLSMQGFLFGRKTVMDKLFTQVANFDPILVRLDSAIAMLPGGRQGKVENDSTVGIAIRDDLNKLLKVTRLTFLSAHSKKEVDNWTLKQLHECKMGTMVRGHGSIVGEGCDTGLVIKTISAPDKGDPSVATRFVIINKVRRVASPLLQLDAYVELKEKGFGEGWARLEKIMPTALPPTDAARELFTLFVKNPSKAMTQRQIRREAALYSLSDLRAGLEDLKIQKVILNTQEAFTYYLNPRYVADAEKDYLVALTQ